MTQTCDVLVIGAGPAGIAAATTAARHGRGVLVLDDNPAAGGQIWRSGVQEQSQRRDRRRSATLAAFRASGAKLLPGRRIVDAPEPGQLVAAVETGSAASLERYSFQHLVLATGARERFLPFPGWTFPGVFGAGGLQALVRGGFSVAGKRVVVAGTGPLLLAVAAHLSEDGAHVVTVAEQAPAPRMLRFGLSLWTHPGKLLQGAGYRATLARTPYRMGCWPLAALGQSSLEAVRLTDGRRVWDEPCGLLACGFHLVPNTEVAALLGCRFDGDFVAVDDSQRTSIPNVYAAGEPTQIVGLDAALLEGEIAGLTIAGKPHEAASLFRRRDRERRFGQRLSQAFALREELRTLAQPDTIVCRCEDVRFVQLKDHAGWTDAKLQTRCGMGPCQGRICGPAVETLFGWRPASVRPPLSPIPLGLLCSQPEEQRSSLPQTSNTLQETL
jgi:NADPH-dependent 2,4-dienoyl-CoA reductase/sulfur reductase-like enzyme